MKSFRSKALLSLTLVVLSAAAAHTQAIVSTGGAMGFGVAGPVSTEGRLSAADVPVSVLSAELVLTPDQESKIAGIDAQLRREQDALAPNPANPPDPGSMRETMDKLDSLMKEANRAIESSLTDSQARSLTALLGVLKDFPVAGLPVDVYSSLKLTNEQKSKIGSIAASARAKMDASMAQVRAGMDPAELPALVESDRADTEAKVKAILSDRQNALVAQYLAEHPRPAVSGIMVHDGEGMSNIVVRGE